MVEPRADLKRSPAPEVSSESSDSARDEPVCSSDESEAANEPVCPSDDSKPESAVIQPVGEQVRRFRLNADNKAIMRNAETTYSTTGRSEKSPPVCMSQTFRSISKKRCAGFAW